MKRSVYTLLFAVSAVLFFTSCSKKAADDLDVSLIGKSAVIKFDNDVLDFHTINEGEKVTGSFKFKNTGKNDLIISEVSANCGCTVADYPHNAVKPGETGMISVTYDSKGSQGMRIEKMITVLANTEPSRTVLKITATVQ
ncbi:MAG: DUF1573 domain-containing protein [Bacteroidales bacterium]|nr:DUF1573 domain-containing protein [Bacteroidales bacterium]